MFSFPIQLHNAVSVSAALFLICCVLCCTLYAREGVCHLFDFPDELRRQDSNEHFLTVDEFLELERRHRLGLPVDSLLELQKKRRSEAEAGSPPPNDIAATEEDWERPQGYADILAEPQESQEPDAFDMSGQSAGRLASSVADMRPPQAQWSAPRMRRSMSLDRAMIRDGDDFGSRPGQYAAPPDAPISPGASPLQYDAPPSQQGGEYPRQIPPGDRLDLDPTAGQREEGGSAPESASVPLNASEDPNRNPADDPRYQAEYRRPSYPQDSLGPDRGYPRRSDPELSRHAADRGYGIDGAPGGPGRPPDGYDQWSLRGRPADGVPPLSEAYDRSPQLDQRDSGRREPLDRAPSGADRPAADGQLADRQGPDDGRRYSSLQRYGAPAVPAPDGRRVPSREGAMAPPGTRVSRSDFKTEIPPSARGQVYPQGGARNELQRPNLQDPQALHQQEKPMGDLEDQRRGVYPPDDFPRSQPDRHLQHGTPNQHWHPDTGYADDDRGIYPDHHLQQRTPSGRRLVYNDYDYPPQKTTVPRYEIPSSTQGRSYDDSRGMPDAQRYSSQPPRIPRQQEYDVSEQGMQHERPVSRRPSQVYGYVDQGYPVHPDTVNVGYRRGDGTSSRVSSQSSISRHRPSRSFPEGDAVDVGRGPDGRYTLGERDMVDSFGRPVSNAADMRDVANLPPRPDYPGRQDSVTAERVGSRQWVIGPDGRRYLVPTQSRHSITVPATPRHWSRVHSPRMEFSAEGPANSRIFGAMTMPVGIYGEASDMNDPTVPEYAGRYGQQLYDDRYVDDPRRPEKGWTGAADESVPTDPYSRSEGAHIDQQPPARPSGLMQRVRSVSVSRMSHSLRQMVAGKPQSSSRSRSEEPRGPAAESPRGSAAWLLHRIRSMRGVSEQPAAAPRAAPRRRQERRSDRLNRSHGPQDSLTGSEGGVSGAADWPSSVEDLEEGEYVSPSRRDGEGSRQPTPMPTAQAPLGPDEELPTEVQKQSPAQDEPMRPPENTVPEKQPTPEKESIQYVLEDHQGRKRLVAVAPDHPGIDHYPPSKAFGPPTGDKRAASDYTENSDDDVNVTKKKGQKKRKDKDTARHPRSDESLNGQTKRKKAKSKKKKKKHSHKRSKSSRSSSSSSSSSRERSSKKSKRYSASLCRDSDQSDSDDSDYHEEYYDHSYDDGNASAEENDRREVRSASRESYKAGEQRRHRDNRFSERSSYGQEVRRPYPSYYQRRGQSPLQEPARSRWDSASPARGGPARSETPPDRELTPERGRSELNRHGQPRHRPVVFQNESLRSFVSQPPRRAFGQRGRPPRTGRGTVPTWMRRPFQTNQSFMPWQQYPESPQRGRARGPSPDHLGPRTPPPPSPSPSPPRQGPERLSPSTTPPGPPPRAGPSVLEHVRTRPPRDPRLCAARSQMARNAAARECQMRRAVLGEPSREDIGCTTKLKRFFDE